MAVSHLKQVTVPFHCSRIAGRYCTLSLFATRFTLMQGVGDADGEDNAAAIPQRVRRTWLSSLVRPTTLRKVCQSYMRPQPATHARSRCKTIGYVSQWPCYLPSPYAYNLPSVSSVRRGSPEARMVQAQETLLCHQFLTTNTVSTRKKSPALPRTKTQVTV